MNQDSGWIRWIEKENVERERERSEGVLIKEPTWCDRWTGSPNRKTQSPRMNGEKSKKDRNAQG